MSGHPTLCRVRAIGLSSGRTLVAWDSPNGGLGGGHAIRGRLLDATGTPIGNEFIINATKFPAGGASWLLSLNASTSGGAIVSYYAPTSIFDRGVQQYNTFRAGILPDGSLSGEEISLDKNQYVPNFGSNVGLPNAFENYNYYVSILDDGKQAAFYSKNSGLPVRIDDGDLYRDAVGVEQPPFQAIRLTDGRILFSYLTGFYQRLYPSRYRRQGGDPRRRRRCHEAWHRWG